MEIGIVGLPNVGKSTLFNALLKTVQAQAGNFPFTTIEPNVGVVAMPDERLDRLAALVKPEKVTPATVRFVDIAGLVKGAHTGEGLGNQFLSHIREVDAIALVIRCFRDPNVPHVAGKIDPLEDIRTIHLELILADLETVSHRLETVAGKAKTGAKDAIAQQTLLQKLQTALAGERLISDLNLSQEERGSVRSFGLLTAKPFLYVANVDEADVRGGEWERLPYPMIPISAKIEADLTELEPIEQSAYLESLGLKESGQGQLIRAAYRTLGLLTYFTAGPKEVRAWTVRNGSRAPEAAGVIHSDFARGFIAAEVIGWQKLLEAGSWNEAKAKGWVRTEGKKYIMQDGDVVLFRFNV